MGMLKDKVPKKYRWIFPTLIICALFVIYFTGILKTLGTFIGYFVPLITGACVAYIMNIPMKALDRVIFPRAKDPRALKLKKVFLVTLTFLLILAFIIFLIYLVVPSLQNTVKVFIKYLPSVFDKFKAWVETNRNWFPDFADSVAAYKLDVNELVNLFTGFVTNDTGSMISSTFSVITNTVSGIYNVLMSSIFALYVLYNKKTLSRQFRRIFCAYAPSSIHAKVDVTLVTANKCFSAFIGGQCVQAIILGILCVLLMSIFGFPEPVMIGVFVGATSVIPLLGSYLGSAVGILIVTAIAPQMALWYALFILILQQFVASVIYPKVVGRSTGLPGMWVLAGVLVGGAMAGIVGMIIGVPITATLYQLLRADVARREKNVSQPKESVKDTDEAETLSEQAPGSAVDAPSEEPVKQESIKPMMKRAHANATAKKPVNKKKR